jgi:hypothetical protein
LLVPGMSNVPVLPMPFMAGWRRWGILFESGGVSLAPFRSVHDRTPEQTWDTWQRYGGDSGRPPMRFRTQPDECLHEDSVFGVYWRRVGGLIEGLPQIPLDRDGEGRHRNVVW